MVKHGYSGRRPAAELLARLHSAPTGTLDDTLTEAVRDAVLALVTVLTAVGGALKNLDRSVRHNRMIAGYRVPQVVSRSSSAAAAASALTAW